MLCSTTTMVAPWLHQAVQHASRPARSCGCSPVEGSSSTSSWPAERVPAQVARQLDALRLAAGEGGRRLSQGQVAQPDILQRLQDVPRRLAVGGGQGGVRLEKA